MLIKKKILILGIPLVICIITVAGWWFFFNKFRTANYDVVYLPCDTTVSSFATKINNSGQVAGKIAEKGFFWQEGQGLVIFGDDETIIMTVDDMNDHGQVVGLCNKHSNSGVHKHQAFIWDKKAGLMFLPESDNITYNQMVINNQGQVAGVVSSYKDEASKQKKGELYTWNANDGIKFIDDLQVDLSSVVGITDTGQVGGFAKDEKGSPLGFVWNKSEGLTLTGSEVNIRDVHDLDDKGRLWATTVPDSQLVIWDKNNGITELGSFGFDAIGRCSVTIDKGLVGVGAYYPMELLDYKLSRQRTFSFYRDSKGDIFRFDDLFKNGDFWELDINETGWIVGFELDEDRTSPTRAVLLKPKKK